MYVPLISKWVMLTRFTTEGVETHKVNVSQTLS